MSAGIDVHQHLWPERLLEALARRDRPPLLRRSRGEWLLRIEGEPEWPVDPADHDPERRAAALADDDLERAVVALSSPLGIEALPADEAAELLEAYHEGVADLPHGLMAWAAAGLAEPDPAALAALLDRGFVGLCLPAGALSGPDGVIRVAPLLAVLEERDAPLFVHPGPAPWSAVDPHGAGGPAWWPALTGYVAQMSAAWLAFRTWVRPAHPDLRACFAMLAGLAPLQGGRLASRGVDLPATDPGLFLDTSSYGPDAVRAVADVVGLGSLVYGSDRPVVSPPPGVPGGLSPTLTRALNPARLLALQEVHA
ncbi:MAG: amidohydrolase family protein [Thermoleophilia bacterium]